MPDVRSTSTYAGSLRGNHNHATTPISNVSSPPMPTAQCSPDKNAALKGKAHVIAACYVECVLTQGREIPGVLAALSGSPELATVKRQYQQAFIEKCQAIFARFAGPQSVPLASLWAMLGAADALSHAAVVGDISEDQAKDELMETILAMVRRCARLHSM